MEHLNILFFLKKNKTNALGEAPIHMRLTLNSRRSEISTGQFIDPWDNKSEEVTGRTEEVRAINERITSLRAKTMKHYNILLSNEEKEITVEMVKNSLQNKKEKAYTLLELIKFHNDQMKNQVGTQFAKGTYSRYLVTYRKLESFIKTTYSINDIALEKVKYKFITDFEYHLKTHDKCDHNTSMKYIKNLKKVIRIALANDWLEKDPFIGFKCTSKETNRGYLTQEELDVIIRKTFSIQRLEMVKDIFIFSCYTGLAFTDVEKLAPADITTGIDKKKWLVIHRTKTDTRCSVPLLPPAMAILEKYKNFPENSAKGRLLPVTSNQKINAYLKEIADMCGISKVLTFHIARHTFCTTVTLANGVPIETISKMVGHRSIRTTQIYSKIVDSKISEDMSNLEKRLEKKLLTA